MGNSDERRASKRWDDAEFERVPRQDAPLVVARLEFERDDGDRISGAGGEREDRRLGSQRGFAALIGEAPLEPGAFRRIGGAGEPHGNFKALACANGRARRLRDDQPGLLQTGQPIGERARIVLNVHEAVQFPLHVVELGDDIAGDRPLPAQRFDLALEAAILKLLRRAHEAIEVSENRCKLRVAKARLDPMRIGCAEVPVVAAFEPPWLAAVRLQNLARMRQSPDAELRADERLVAAPLCVAMRREGPGGAVREGARRRCESLVLMREAVIPMEILDLGLEVVVARKAGGIVDKQAVGDERLRPVEGLDQPAPVVRIVVEIDTPSLVEQRPDCDRGMMPVLCDRRLEHALQHFASRWREELHVRHIEPDNETQSVGEFEIERIGNLDVAAERVEAHRLGVSETLFEKCSGRRATLLLGMPILIEGAEHDEGFAVEHEAPVFRFEAPKADASLDRNRQFCR